MMKIQTVLGNCMLAKVFADGCGIDKEEQELLKSVYRESLYCTFLPVLEATFFYCYKIHEGYHMLIFSTPHKTFNHRCPEPAATVLGIHIHTNKHAAYMGKMTMTRCVCPRMYLIRFQCPV